MTKPNFTVKLTALAYVAESRCCETYEELLEASNQAYEWLMEGQEDVTTDNVQHLRPVN